MINTSTESNLRKTGFIYLIHLRSQSIVEGRRGKNWIGNKEAGTEAEAMQECCSWLAVHGYLSPFFSQPKTTCPGTACPTVDTTLPHQPLIKKKKKVPRDLPTGKSAGDHSLGGFFLVEGQTNTIKRCFLYSPSFLAPKTLLVNQKKKKWQYQSKKRKGHILPWQRSLC